MKKVVTKQAFKNRPKKIPLKNPHSGKKISKINIIELRKKFN